MRTIGKEAEELAEKFLSGQGLHLIARNFHCRAGEIDLIMKDEDTLVFIEVRYRKNHDHGDALETITTSKQRKILKAVKRYLTINHCWNFPCRIDAVGMTPSETGELTFNWIKNAIQDY